MSFNDWLLALHVLTAFAYVAGVVLFWILIVAVRRIDTPEETIRIGPIVNVGNAAVGIGAGGTIVLGIWLAFALDGYAIWDGWIIAALVLWAIAAAFGQRTGVAYMQGMTKAKELDAAGQRGANAELLALNRTSNGVLMHALTSVVVLLILLDMIFKPGA
ncbi:MAG TPA: hypothetical protein VHQ96_02000 [Gaiellaceae bacterium]|nr:hypothetical protein [Gaiellaceae bacterium]